MIHFRCCMFAVGLRKGFLAGHSCCASSSRAPGRSTIDDNWLDLWLFGG